MKIGRWVGACLVAMALGLGSAPVAHASQAAGEAAPPIATGHNPEKMDAGETNSEMEQYRHSAAVRALARALGQPVERTATILEDVNSLVVIALLAWGIVKFVPPAFRARREQIGQDLAEAQTATAMANERLRVVEGRLQSLDAEIEALRAKAAADAEGDRKRIEASLEVEKARIVQSAEAEIVAAGAQAQRELKQFAAGLAVERAMGRLALTPDQDRALIDEFTGSLGAELAPEGRRN